MTLFEYLEVEDRIYRVPLNGDPRLMERWSAEAQQWIPYQGDVARVLIESTSYGTTCPELP